MGIKIVEGIQSISNSFFDVFFEIITKLGEEGIFLLVFGVTYLCMGRHSALKLILVYLVAYGVNSVIKVLVDRPRPYLASSSVDNKLPTDGSSMPSGHSQGYFSYATSLSYFGVKKHKSKALPFVIIAFFVGIMVMLSRVYLGQHYLSDVIVGMVVGVVVACVMNWVLDKLPAKTKNILCGDTFIYCLSGLSAILFLVFLIVELTGGHAMSDKIYKFLGVFVALGVGVFIDKKFIKFNCGKNSVSIMIISTFVLMGIYLLLDWIFAIKTYWFFVIYFIMGIVCTIILPLLFKLMFKGKCDEKNKD